MKSMLIDNQVITVGTARQLGLNSRAIPLMRRLRRQIVALSLAWFTGHSRSRVAALLVIGGAVRHM